MNDTPIRTVIYIEDSDDEVFLARRMLRRRGASMDLIHFDSFDPFESAIDTGLTIDSQTSILVIDLNLKFKFSSGNEAIRRLRERRISRHSLLGVCTGSEDPTDRKEAHAAGADFFVPKPLVPLGLEAICSEVDSLLWLADSADGYPFRRIGAPVRVTL